MKIPIVDESDNVIEYKDRSDVLDSDLYRVAYLWVTDEEGNILLAQRAFTKAHHPGCWGPAVAGTVEEGETYEQNIVKESEEELGLVNIKPDLGIKKLVRSKWSYFSQEFLLKLPVGFNDFKLDATEVINARWFSKDELRIELEKNPDIFLKTIQEHLKDNE